MESKGRSQFGARQRMDAKAASVDNSFKKFDSEGRLRNGAVVAGGSMESREPFQR